MTDVQCALYARVSSESQARDNTIASQVAALRERIVADGFLLEPDHSYEDEGYSGSILSRPALERLRDAVLAAVSNAFMSMLRIGWRAVTPIRFF
jgi:site-specific DNA recombinase